jgi:signal transduction histidine kinase
VRRSVHLLRASLTHGSLVEAVHALAEESRHAGVEVDVEVDGAPRRLPPAVEFALYRVAQEGLTNVRRHASSTNARVALRFEEGSALVRVSDAGHGASTPEGAGHGLLGIRERAAQLGGTVEIRTAPGGGFELSVRVPA